MDETRENEILWLFFCGNDIWSRGVYLARIDAVLRGACKKQLHHSRFATYGLYLFCLIAAALMLYAVWLWVAETVKKNRFSGNTVLAVCARAAFLAADTRVIMQRSISVQPYLHRRNIKCCMKKAFFTI